MTLARCALLLPILLLASCAGYKLGASRPTPLRHVSSIHLEMVESKSQMPRIAAHASNAIADAFTRDGTYRLESSDKADARLTTVLHSIHYEQVRSSRLDTLRSEELEMKISLRWTLVDGDNPTRVLDSGTSLGSARFFVDPNLQTARQSAITDALKRASESLVDRLANGF